MSGGPMYYLRHRLGSKKGAAIYAVFVAMAAIGLGCLVQSNSVVEAITGYFMVSKLITGIALAIITGLVIIGGVQSIARVAGVLVPFMALSYIVAGLIILIYHYQNIIPGSALIIKSAFVGQAPMGGFLGSTIWLSLQNGAQYGVFANEAGLGSLAIASASAKTNNSVEQGMRSIAGVFIATMIICTITGLVLAVSNVVGSVDQAGVVKGSRLVMLAFATVSSKLNIVVILSLAMFAFTTALAWCYYGEKSIEYLFGIKYIVYYRWFFILCILFGAILKLDVVWSIANLSIGLMSIPNLIALIMLRKEVKLETEKYFVNH
jgi:AGCS family alanine or glycine:cation symporter